MITIPYNDSAITYLGRWVNGATNWQGGLVEFKVAGTSQLIITADVIDNGDSGRCMIAINIDDGNVQLFELTTTPEAFTGEKSVTIPIPDTGEHTIRFKTSFTPNEQYLGIGRITLKNFKIDDSGHIYLWERGSKTLMCVGDSWMGAVHNYPERMDRRYKLYPVSYGGAAVADIRARFPYSSPGVSETDPNVDAVIVGLGVNDYDQGITTSAYQSDMEILVDSIRSTQPTAQIFLIQAPRNVSAGKNFDQYGTVLQSIASSRNNVYYVTSEPTWNTLTWVDPWHLDFAGRLVFADYIDEQLTPYLFTEVTTEIISGALANSFQVGVTPLGSTEVLTIGFGVYEPNTLTPKNFVLGAMTTGDTKTVQFDVKNTGTIAGVFNLSDTAGFNQSYPVEPGAKQLVSWPVTFSQTGAQSQTLTVEFVTTQGTTTDTYTATSTVTDNDAPTVTSFDGTRVSDTQIDLTCTATDNIGVTAYEWYNRTTLLGTTATGSYSATVQANVSVTLGVIAVDAAGNKSVKVTKTFSTTADTEAPTQPTNLRATAVYPKIDLSWNASTDNVGVTGYEVERSDTQALWDNIGNPVSTSFTDQNVTPGQTYYYRIRAFDGAGNKSAYSAVVSAIAQEAADTAPPTAGVLTGTAVSHKQIDLSCTAPTDNKAVVKQELYRDNVVIYTVYNSLAFTYSDTQRTQETSYTYYVKAYDAAGNTANSNSIMVTTLKFVPPDNRFAKRVISSKPFVERGELY